MKFCWCRQSLAARHNIHSLRTTSPTNNQYQAAVLAALLFCIVSPPSAPHCAQLIPLKVNKRSNTSR